MTTLRTLLSHVFSRTKAAPVPRPPNPRQHAPESGGKQLFGEQRPTQAADGARVRTTRTGRRYIVVGTPTELAALRNDPPRAKNTHIVLSGNLVIMAGEEEVSAPIQGYHRQTDRIVRPLRSLTKRNTQFTLKVWLHEDAVALKHALPRHSIYLAIDQYLAWGRNQQKGNIHLVTGYGSTDDTIVHVFSFSDGALTAITEKVLVPTFHHQFGPSYKGLIAGLNRSGYTVVVADPLPQPDEEDIHYLDGNIYEKTVSYFVVDETAEPSFLVRHGLATGLGVLSIAAWLAAMAVPYDAYNDATTNFRRISSSIPQNDLAFGSDQLKTMRERRLFLNDKRPQDDAAPFLRRITGALAGSDTLIRSLSLNRVKTQPNQPDIAMTVEMKRTAGASVVEQAKPVLDRLSERLGIDFSLTANGYQERANGNDKVLILNIEANLKGKSA